jgi:hypothetical protein
MALGVSALVATGAIGASAQNNSAQNQQQLLEQQQKNQQANQRQQFLFEQQQKNQQANQRQQFLFPQQQKKQQQANQQQQFLFQRQQVNQQQREVLVQQRTEFEHFDWNTYYPGRRPPLWTQYRENFDPRPYEWVWTAPRSYEVQYVPPPGWSYQRWYYGQVLPAAYWVQPYWVVNYPHYGLQPLPYGYVWVQYGPDALAVDTVTGVILQVVYGLFSSGLAGL